MICTVSTVKDSRANIEAFIARNLAAGADHMFIFLDQGDRDPNAWLQSNEHVTVVRTGPSYWRGRRPANLNRRQNANANLVNFLLTPFDDVAWLFHIDGDECLDIDNDVLAGIDPALPSVRLLPLEAVSRRVWDTDVDYFKRRLTQDELYLLHSLDVIKAPTNDAYFNGHQVGKAGIRPSLALRLGIHVGRDRQAREVASIVHEALHVLHYESFSEAEFLRKWEVHLNSGPAGFNPQRDQLATAIKAVLNHATLPAERKRAYLAQLYRTHVEDDFETLRELGVLFRLTERAHSHKPSGFAPHDVGAVAVLLDRLLAADRAHFARLGNVALDPVQLMASLRSELARSEPRLAKQIGAALDRTQPPPLAPPRQRGVPRSDDRRPVPPQTTPRARLRRLARRVVKSGRVRKILGRRH